MLYKVTHCAGRVSANTRPHQLHWGDREMGTAISCTECSQPYSKIGKESSKAPSLRAAVLRAAVFCSKIVCSDRNRHHAHLQHITIMTAHSYDLMYAMYNYILLVLLPRPLLPLAFVHLQYCLVKNWWGSPGNRVQF